MIETTYMTVIDPKSGDGLWMDGRRWGSLRVAGATKDLTKELRNQMDVPEFCRRAGLIIGSDNKITGYEVIAYGDETIDVGDVLEKADQFDFACGRYAKTD